MHSDWLLSPIIVVCVRNIGFSPEIAWKVIDDDNHTTFQLNFNFLSLAIRFTCSVEQNWGCLSIPWAAAAGEFGSFGSCQFLFCSSQTFLILRPILSSTEWTESTHVDRAPAPLPCTLRSGACWDVEEKWLLFGQSGKKLVHFVSF